MPVVATQRKVWSDLIKGVMEFEENTKTNFNTFSVTVGGTDTIGSIGVPVIWNDANSRFEVFVAQDIAAAITTGGSPLPDGSVIGVLVGDRFGWGFNKSDIDLSLEDVPMTILYRGDVTLVNAGMEWGDAIEVDQLLFEAQLQEQRIDLTANRSATDADTSFVGV